MLTLSGLLTVTYVVLLKPFLETIDVKAVLARQLSHCLQGKSLCNIKRSKIRLRMCFGTKNSTVSTLLPSSPMLVIQITHVVSDEAPASLQANIHTYKQCLLEHIDGSGEEHAATEWTAVV